MRSQFQFSNPKLVRATRLSLAMLISFVYTTYVGVSNGIWVMMTCAIVLFDNPTLGGTLNKSHLRFWGTFFSTMFALLFIVVFANNVITNLIAIVIGVFLATYWFMDTQQAYAGGLITWTLPILLINNNNLREAFTRMLNVSLGILISYIMVRFFYPEYARDNLLQSLHKTMSELQTLLHAVVFPGLNNRQIQELYLQHEAPILSEINHFMRWVEEAKVESRRHEYVESATAAYLHVRRLYRLVSLIIFHFDCGTIRGDQQIHEKFTLICERIELIISALEQNYHAYYLPEELAVAARHTSSEGNLEYIHYQAVSLLTITEIVLEELDAIMVKLTVFFQARDAHFYRRRVWI
jgi:hypothetical protein